MKATMRLFVAIPLAQEVIDALERFARSLRSEGDGLRWSSPESWHITLQFLGETSGEKHGCVVARLRNVRATAAPVQLNGTGFFDRAGVFFAGVSISAEMVDLEKQVLAATSQCGFAAEERPFHPHVTLARAKGDNRMNALRRLKRRVKENVGFPAFTATEFRLYEAFLGPGGSRYEVRERFRLGER
jgi:RNA 2',3'-cyclic 3'-phosphodiesterase